jgi:hypothetical protein
MCSLSSAVDAFPSETTSDYNHRMESWLASQQCNQVESGMVQCEKAANHVDLCACPDALKIWLSGRYGLVAAKEFIHA